MCLIHDSDKNTCFFHRVNSKIKSVNSIWYITNGHNNIISSQHDIQKDVVNFFKSKCRESQVTNIVNQMDMVMVNEEELDTWIVQSLWNNYK